eukprot:6925680-Prymnesium_polylepis.1
MLHPPDASAARARTARLQVSRRACRTGRRAHAAAGTRWRQRAAAAGASRGAQPSGRERGRAAQPTTARTLHAPPVSGVMTPQLTRGVRVISRIEPRCGGRQQACNPPCPVGCNPLCHVLLTRCANP